MYGYRGSQCHVDLHSPYEMIRRASRARSVPVGPTKALLAFRKMQEEKGANNPTFKAGLHYIGIEVVEGRFAFAGVAEAKSRKRPRRKLGHPPRQP